MARFLTEKLLSPTSGSRYGTGSRVNRLRIFSFPLVHIRQSVWHDRVLVTA
jgi:hypothetical protein